MTTLEAPATSDVATLTVDGKTWELPIIEGSEGERAIDVSTLRGDTGLITLDLGYANTGSAMSDITFIDGEAGILRYRGYPIEELAEHSTFLETAYLLLYGELPTSDQLATIEGSITNHTLLHEDIRHMYRAFPLAAHPMAVSAAVVGALSTFYPDSVDPLDPEQVEISTYRLIAKLPTICAVAFKYAMGHPFNYPRNDLSYAENMLYMMFGLPTEEYEVNDTFTRAVETLLILHADHEQNCSTSTMRMVGSSRANIYASASAAIMALWGPLHGGANQAVIEMLHDIAENEGSARVFMDKAKDIIANARGIQNVWLGDFGTLRGPGIVDLVAATDQALADRLTEEIAVSVANATSIPAPFDAHLLADLPDSSPGRRAVLKTIESLEDQTDTIVAAGQLIGVTVSVS